MFWLTALETDLTGTVCYFPHEPLLCNDLPGASGYLCNISCVQYVINMFYVLFAGSFSHPDDSTG